MLVFVYGTLKRGHGNNRILEGQSLIGSATVKGYRLHGRGFPVAVPDDTAEVIGELWDIGDDTRCLARLDGLEGYYGANSPHNMYNRDVVSVYTIDHESTGMPLPVEANMYVGGSSFWDRGSGWPLCPTDNEGRYYFP